jgi:hypothetical protein
VRTLCAAVLGFQSLIFALAIPVAVAVYGVDGAAAGWVGGSLAVACLLVAGLLRFAWAYWLGWGIQAAAIASALVVPVMLVLGVIFALLWWGALRLGTKGDAAQAAFRAQAAADGDGPGEGPVDGSLAQP